MMMDTNHTALSAAEDGRCSCAETTTAVGKDSTLLCDSCNRIQPLQYTKCISSLNVNNYEHQRGNVLATV